MSSRRSWYTNLLMITRTALRTMTMFRNYGMGEFVPFMAFLFAGAVVLWLVNAIAPLAPFVYSLF
jgi:hypothetical protein